MNVEYIKACLNLYAVLKNLEDLAALDPDAAQIVKEWDISIQFSVAAGPGAWVAFKNGVCGVGRGEHIGPAVRLLFVHCRHLNKMMDGKALPIPIKGLRHLGFLSREFPKLTDRLAYFLKPDDDLLADPAYLAMNTRLSLTTAAFAVREIGLHDPIGKLAAGRMNNGVVMLKVAPNGPAVHIAFKDGDILPGKGEMRHPSACLEIRDMAAANAFLNGKMDAFAAIAQGLVAIRGRIPMLDGLSLMLDRIPNYLSRS